MSHDTDNDGQFGHGMGWLKPSPDKNGGEAILPLPPVGAYLCESVETYAKYWLKAAHEARDAGRNGDAVMFAEQAVNGWKNLAYDLARQAHYYLKTQRHYAEQHTHDLYKTGDKNAPPSILDRNGEVVLGLCKLCGMGEAELVEPCAPSHVAPNCPYRSYKDHDPANCGHCSSPSTTRQSIETPRTDALRALMGEIYEPDNLALDHMLEKYGELERELAEAMNRCDEALEGAEAAVRQRDSALSTTPQKTYDQGLFDAWEDARAKYEPMLAASAASATPRIPDVLFDGHVVFLEANRAAGPEHTLKSHHVSAVLDAVVRLLRAADGGKETNG